MKNFFVSRIKCMGDNSKDTVQNRNKQRQLNCVVAKHAMKCTTYFPRNHLYGHSKGLWHHQNVWEYYGSIQIKPTCWLKQRSKYTVNVTSLDKGYIVCLKNMKNHDCCTFIDCNAVYYAYTLNKPCIALISIFSSYFDTYRLTCALQKKKLPAV